MIGVSTEYKLASLLQALSNGEKDIEISRQVLAERSAFEPYAAFKRLTRGTTSSLSAYQVLDFLRENEFAVVEKDVRNVFRLYSTETDGKLSYTDYLELILPRNSTYIREICTQRDSYYVADDEILPYEVELGLAKIFDKEINLSRKAELLKEDLVSKVDFNLRAAYEIIAEENRGKVDFDALYNFFNKNQITVIEKDIIALLRRTDTDKDGKLSYSEFTEAILPADEYYRRLGENSTRAKPALRTSTPQRQTSKVATSPKLFSSASKKLTNYDYYSYVSESAKRSTLGRSASPARTTAYDESHSALSPRESFPLTQSVYKTPTKTVASPRGRSPGRSETKSPMKGNEEEQLVKAIREQVELDKELEGAKDKLALQDDFNLYDAFRFFDLKENGYITRTELREGFNDFDVFPSSDEMFLIMKKYNKDEDGLLKYSDFCDLLRPTNAGYAHLLVERKPIYVDRAELSEIFAEYTIELLTKVLNKVVENEFHSEKVRQRLARRPLFDSLEAFEALDKSKIGFITKFEFRDLLANHGFYATQKELQSLLARYDRNEDGKVSYTEFIKEITPKSPEKI